MRLNLLSSQSKSRSYKNEKKRDFKDSVNDYRKQTAMRLPLFTWIPRVKRRVVLICPRLLTPAHKWSWAGIVQVTIQTVVKRQSLCPFAVPTGFDLKTGDCRTTKAEFKASIGSIVHNIVKGLLSKINDADYVDERWRQPSCSVKARCLHGMVDYIPYIKAWNTRNFKLKQSSDHGLLECEVLLVKMRSDCPKILPDLTRGIVEQKHCR